MAVDVPFGSPVTLAVQEGQYDLRALCSGSQKFTTTLAIETKRSAQTLQLKPGGDVRFEIVRPDGEHDAMFIILRAGRKLASDYFDWETKTHRGLPSGDYLIHIPSSAEAFAAPEDRERGFAPLHGYAGRDVPFTILGGSAGTLELGEIRLDPAR